jgi:hypothetical protein
MNMGLSIYESSDVYSGRTMTAPYICFYHFKDEAIQQSKNFDGLEPETSLLMDYLQEATDPMASKAGGFFASGKVTAELMPYLFPPGGLVCLKDLGNWIVCEQTSLLRVVQESGTQRQLRQVTFRCSMSRLTYDGEFRRVTHADQTVSVATAEDRAAVIEKLLIRPLSHVPVDLQHDLNRRGTMFLRFRRGQYVMCPNAGTDSEDKDLVGDYKCESAR